MPDENHLKMTISQYYLAAWILWLENRFPGFGTPFLRGAEIGISTMYPQIYTNEQTGVYDFVITDFVPELLIDLSVQGNGPST